MKKIITGPEARKKILDGTTKLCDAVSLTLGPRGRNVILTREDGSRLITNDGVTIAREVDLECPFERVAAATLREASLRTNTDAGDGTTSAIVLATSVIKEGMRAVDQGASPILLKEELLSAARAAIDSVNQASVECHTESLLAVAVNSCQNPDDGQIVSDAFERVGKDGVVTIEENNEGQTYLKFSDGCEINARLAHPYMIGDQRRMETIFENTHVLITRNGIKSAKELLPLLEYIMAEKIRVVLVAPSYSDEVTQALVINKLRAGLDIIALVLDEPDDRLDAVLGDLSALTGTAPPADDTQLKNPAQHFGHAHKIIAGIHTSKILGPAANDSTTEPKARLYGGVTSHNPILENRISLITAQIADAPDDYQKHRLSERLAKLTTGIATISVGCATEVERLEKKLRVEDAVHAVRAALRDGIVPGGGTTYILCSQYLNKKPETMGTQILARALLAIPRQIYKNADVNADLVLEKILESTEPSFGYDALNKKYCNMTESNIIDPTAVIKCVIQNATSVAATLLTTDCMIVPNS